MSRFLDGGIDTVLVEYIRHLAQDERYHITLAIATYMGKLEVFLPVFPKAFLLFTSIGLPFFLLFPKNE